MILFIYPLIGLIEDQVKAGQPLGLTCASLQDVIDLFSHDPVPQHLFVLVEKALGNQTSQGSSKTLKDRSSKVPQQVRLIVVDE